MKQIHRTNRYIMFMAGIMLTIVITLIVFAGRTKNLNQLMAYKGSERVDITEGWKNTSDHEINIRNITYFNADGCTPYVFHRTLPDYIPENTGLDFLTKNAGFAVFISDDKKQALTQIDYDSVTEENNIVTEDFKAALNKFVYNNAETYGLTDCISVYCGLGTGLGPRGTGNSLHTMSISEYAGKEAYIVLFPVYKSSKISNIRLQNEQYFTQDMIQNTFMGFVISLVIVIIANVILMMSLFMDNISKKTYGPLAMFILDISLWSLLSSRTFDFVLGTSEFTNTMSFYLWMFIPVFGSVFMDSFTYAKHKSMASVVCPVTTVYILLATVSNYAGWYDLYETKIITDIFIFVIGLVSIYLFIQDIRFRKEHNFQPIHGIIIISMIITIILGFVDALRYTSTITLDGAQDNAFYIRLGVMVLVMGVLLDLYSGYVSQHKKASLAVTFKDIAFLDELTGIGNRSAFARYEVELEAMIKDLSAKADDSQSIVYVSLDLNDLKYVNDNLGHAIGDVYIKTAARILRTSFHSANIYRVGGDEFSIFIVGKDARADYEGGLKRMLRAQEDYNRTANSGIQMEFAYGVSEWRYFDMRNLHQLEVDADKAMYAKKREMKLQNGKTDRK